MVTSPQAPVARPEVLSSLDPNVRLRDILQTLPQDIFEKSAARAWLSVAISVIAVAGSYVLLALSPWYLLPFAWALTGTALTGFFVVGHDCGHRSFSNSTRVNNIVGHLAFLPLAYPFHAWRILHNHHHKHTNKLGVDNAWDPVLSENFLASPKLLQWGYAQVRGRFWWLGSIGHWAMRHFAWNQFEGKQREQVRFSALFVIVGVAIAFPLLIATLGLEGWVKFWLLPWMVYHFWMSTFTIVHHTLPEIPFRPASEWNEAQAQLAGTVHCDYPAWVEFLCHDINVHIPHHVSTAIPSYKLRQAHKVLQEHWGEYLIERKFTWSLMKEITDRCHLYNKEFNYRSVASLRAEQASKL
ncbi:MAG: fatty acid desaturase [Synechococcales cyanobacterium CRU_2_2]|nr:fatty acid desaturase [Synechococcales cyanobacterium CRU_2_2]